jgi:histidine phosphotransfer protein HptB
VSSSPDGPPLDPKVLAKLREAMRGSGIDLVSELIEMFLEDGPEMLAEIRSAYAEGEISQLAIGAHNLKGSVANLGAIYLAEVCKEVETAARAEELEPLGQLLESLCAEYERVIPALQAEQAAA